VSEQKVRNRPEISVIVPVYRVEKYLNDCIDSILAQTFADFELILVDDGSPDNCPALCDAAAAKDSRIRVIHQKNRGLSGARNAGLDIARGRWAAFVDSDDMLLPQALEKAHSTAEKTGADVVLYGFAFTDENGKVYEGWDTTQYDEVIPQQEIYNRLVIGMYQSMCNKLFRRELFEQVGGERPECDGSQDHDLFLRLIEQVGGAAHVPQVLYYWRVHAGSTSGGADAKPYVAAAAKKALADHLTRTGRTGTVEDGLFPSTYRVKWDIVGEPKVSILIPNKDHTEDLEKCLHSIWTKTEWEHFEVIVVENNSTDPATFAYYKKAQQRYDGLRVVTYPKKGFNFSGINNFGRKYATGEYLLLLNNDVEVRSGEWLTELLRQCAHPGGAAVCGAMLFYPDETIQHAGVITGLGGYAGHSHKYKKAGGSGYLFRTATVQDFSAVTGACLLVKTSVWDEVKGLDEAFAVAFNDVDFCLRVRDAGYRIAWTPYAQLTHYESKSRGGDEKDPVKARRFAAEQQRLYEVHGKENILHDPYYNPNLTMDREDFSESDDLRGLKEGRITVQWRE